VSIGRGTTAATVLVLAVGVAGSPAAVSAAEPGPVQPLAKKGKNKRVKIVIFKSRVASDGFLTPGRVETVTVSRLPARNRFKMAIEAPPTTLQCGQLYFCDVAPVSPAPGSPPFFTTKKGQAVVSFVMPDTYNIATDPFDPATRRPVTWADGQRVHIDIEGVKRKHRMKKIGFGFGRAGVQLGQ
jgi:hypothetical protein